MYRGKINQHAPFTRLIPHPQSMHRKPDITQFDMFQRCCARRDGIEFSGRGSEDGGDEGGDAEGRDVVVAGLLVEVFSWKLRDGNLGEVLEDEGDEGGLAGSEGGRGSENFDRVMDLEFLEGVDVGLGVDDFRDDAFS